MQALEALFHGYAKQSLARWWVGARPVVRDVQVAKAIARQVGLPKSADDPFANSGMILLDWAGAVHVLAVAGTTSLAQDRWSPSAGAVTDAKATLSNLNGNATFISNGRWNVEEPWWSPITSATFDCGVIGFDDQSAFIFWVEEED